MSDELSTSVLLARTVQERDDALAELAGAVEEGSRTLANLTAVRAELAGAQAALAASQQDLSRTRATVVELLSILDQFQVASGADRQAALATGIEACYLARAELASARQELDQLRAEGTRNAG